MGPGKIGVAGKDQFILLPLQVHDRDMDMTPEGKHLRQLFLMMDLFFIGRF